jgi:hypothetical protein
VIDVAGIDAPRAEPLPPQLRIVVGGQSREGQHLPTGETGLPAIANPSSRLDRLLPRMRHHLSLNAEGFMSMRRLPGGPQVLWRCRRSPRWRRRPAAPTLFRRRVWKAKRDISGLRCIECSVCALHRTLSRGRCVQPLRGSPQAHPSCGPSAPPDAGPYSIAAMSSRNPSCRRRD